MVLEVDATQSLGIKPLDERIGINDETAKGQLPDCNAALDVLDLGRSGDLCFFDSYLVEVFAVSDVIV